MTLKNLINGAGELSILVVADSESAACDLQRRFAAMKIPALCHRASSAPEFEQALTQPIDLIFCAPLLSSFSAVRALQLLKAKKLDLPLIVLSSDLSDQSLEDLLAGGAQDYFDTESVDRLRVVVNRVLRESDERRKREAAQEKLRESEERFRELAEHMNEVFWLTDPTGRELLYVSPAYEKIWGRTCASLRESPLSWLDAIHPEDRHKAQEQFLHTNNRAYDVVYRITRPDGEIRWIHDRASKVFDAQRRWYRLAGIAEDITERRTLEMESAARERSFNAFFECASAGMAILDPDLRYVRVNKPLADMNGCSSEGHVGKTLEDVIPDLAPSLRPLFEIIRDSRQPLLNFEFSGETPSQPGVRRSWESSYFPVPTGDGKRYGIGAVIVETTHRKSLEGQLLQAQKLESVGRLAGGVAHDFNNLLCVIQGHANLLQDSAQLTPADSESIEEILRASERAGGVTRQLLTFSRKQVAQARNLDLNETISITAKMLRRLVGEDVKVQLNLPPDLPKIFADAGMIDQVLMNLAVNARDAMPKGGVLTISTDKREVTAEDVRKNPEASSGCAIVLTVADTGFGIPAQILSNIFEPFFTTKEAGKGTGLGLSMVYGIVKQHKGWIAVRSAVGFGTAFEIYLPVSGKDTSPLQSVAAGTGNVRGNETVLLAEDDVDLRFLTRKSLERFGYRVIEADSGPVAVDLWRSNRDMIDVVVSDVIMPGGMTGVDLANLIQSEKPEAPVILMSGYNNDLLDLQREFPKRGGYLAKPFPPAELARAIRKRLDDRAAPAASANS